MPSTKSIDLKQMAKIFVIAIVLIACIGCDQATKFVAKNFLRPDALISFAADTFRLQYAENSGAFLSLGSTLPEPWRHLIFTVLVAIFLFGLLSYALLSRELATRHVVCLSLVCGGGLSNLIDRIAYDGRVVDFLNLGIGSLRTGIFNVADMAITAGAHATGVRQFQKVAGIDESVVIPPRYSLC